MIDTDLEAVSPSLSVTVTVKVLVPVALGVPVILPVEPRVRPVGSVPLLLQVYGVVPPLAAKVVE